MNSNLRNGNGNSNENGRSFRVEIGSISHRCTSSEFKEGRRHSYSIGSFEYIVDDGYEVSGGALNSSIDKQNSVRVLGSELSVERNMKMDYIDRLASMSMSSRRVSFRNSSRFFSGSNRRNNFVFIVEDLEGN
ncbi:Hypothetical predicted protein [Olea europaea subsp. europaea]|uniref:Uncharacterized protein n=1 Tax=Olea europaea subsp. europaea TaxID=158383 RepID=A0A8S0PGF6_OLEEU|nr:Hypothetical predicted protein [Olea europaea subsp. europaea]